jgi:hypothetical protein
MGKRGARRLEKPDTQSGRERAGHSHPPTSRPTPIVVALAHDAIEHAHATTQAARFFAWLPGAMGG